MANNMDQINVNDMVPHMAPPLDHELDRNLRELEELGFTVVHNVFSEQEIGKMQSDYQGVQQMAMQMLSNTPPKVC